MQPRSSSLVKECKAEPIQQSLSNPATQAETTNKVFQGYQLITEGSQTMHKPRTPQTPPLYTRNETTKRKHNQKPPEMPKCLYHPARLYGEVAG